MANKQPPSVAGHPLRKGAGPTVPPVKPPPTGPVAIPHKPKPGGPSGKN